MAKSLADAIGCEIKEPAPLFLSRHVGMALVGAVLSYFVWYRFEFGQICPAMWAGTAPIVIIAVAFFSILELLRSFA